MTPSVIVSLIALGFGMLGTWAGVVIWAVRQEGRINLAFAIMDAQKAAAEAALAAMSKEMSNAVAALAKFDENTQNQVESYQKHTEHKIDELGRNMSAKFEKVFDKLDQKVDKD